VTTESARHDGGSASASPRRHRADGSWARSLAAVPDWLAVTALVVVGAIVPLAIAWHFGALGIPRNDDWAFLLAVFWLARDHGFYFYQWGAMTLVGQVVLAVPTALLLHRPITVLQLEVLASGVVCLVAVYDIGRHLLSRRAALFVALTVAASPLWGPLAPTFMTDVPGLALAMVCLALGVRAVTADGLRPGLYVLSLAAGLMAFSIREYMFVAPVAVGIVATWASSGRDRRARTIAITGLVVAIIVALVFREWARHLPGRENPMYALTSANLRHGASDLFRSIPTVGLLIAPAVLLARPVALLRHSFGAARRTSVAVAVLVALITVEATLHGDIAIGNYMAANGTLGTDTMRGTRPPLLGDPLPAALAFVGAAAFGVLLFAAIPPLFALARRVRHRDVRPPESLGTAMLALALVGTVAAIAVPPALGNSLQDRYLLPLVPLLGILVVRAGQTTQPRQSVRARTVAVAGLVGLAALGLVYTANSASFDATRWAVAESAARSVGDPLLVDGGFEWVNYHYERPAFVRPDDPAHDRFCVAARIEADRPRSTDETVVSAKPVWGIGGPQAWIVARRVADCP